MADQCIVCLETLEQAVPSSPQLPPPDPDATSTDTAGLEDHLRPKSVEKLARIGLAASAITGSAPLQHDHVAEIQFCGHLLHDSCLREWTEKANSCPICRQTFHFVKVYDKVGGNLLSTREVQDKKQVVEFDFQAWTEENPDQEEFQIPCPICDRADNEEILLLCDGCDTPYHTHCIGLDDVPEGHWYCMECVDAIGPAITAQQQVASFQAHSRAQARVTQNRARPSHFPRTQAGMRRARQQAQADSWQGAWGRITNRIWDALNIDIDYEDQEDDEDLESFRRAQQIREEEARVLQRWQEQQRINIASRLGAREVFESNLPRTWPTPPAAREPPPETREERMAWGALERAREMEGTTRVTRKRKSRSNTPEIQEAQHEPERRLKRPRTRRLPTQNGEASSTGEAPSSNQPVQSTPAQNGEVRRSVVGSAPSFLSTLLKEVEMSTPSDEQSLEALFGHIPGANEASSPIGSPSPSGFSSPRASSITPPPNENARGRSPQVALSSHIAPIYPPANFSPTRSISPKRKGPAESRSSPENSDSEHREHRGRHNGTTELRQPRPRRAPPSILSRSDEISPTRSGLSIEMKENISSIVRGALRPHWRSSQLTAEQYETINRSVSHKLYQEVKDPATIPENARESWEKLATKETSKAGFRASAAICSQCRKSQQHIRQPFGPRRFYSSEATAAATTSAQQPDPPIVDAFDPSTADAPIRYRIKSGIILTRPPLLTQTPTPFESAFYLYQKRLNERLQARFRPAMYFKKDTAPELEWKIKLKERRGVPGKDIGRYNPHGRMAWNDEVLVGSTTSSPEHIMEKLLLDAEQRVSDDGEVLPDEDRVPVERPMPRRTEADEKNDVKRLDRALDQTLYLVVKKGEGEGASWQFPSGVVPTEEALHETAARVLAESAGVNMNTWVVGRVPVAHLVKEPVPAEDGKSEEKRGEKVFFLKGRIMAGQADLTGNKHELTDFKWLTKDELKETLPSDYFWSIRNMLELR
ncbi:39S mitochondrial ribosomal protein L46-domain-containing protein [Rhypophila decipiens]|uniref:Large ribosomal subunit protein mL46 n=1 Tax=Rhypophila decipiens TaxID=261697 RepID=A0AAN6YI37_9PEZI|nr:39S mitochondrial ribosomal protein L46-domain-containing protein [Rhypophila decipiens]